MPRVNLHGARNEPGAARVNREPPFDRKPGDKPALDDAEIRDVVTFLRTLTDGYRPSA